MAIIGTLPNTLTNGTTADATQVMADFNKIVNDVNANAAALTNTAVLNANNNFTAVQSGLAATAAANFPIASQVQNEVFNTLSSTLGTNTVTARVAALTLGAYTTGQVFRWIPSQTNSGAATLAIDGLSALSVLNMGSSLSGTELRALIPSEGYYDGVSNAINLIGGPQYVQGPNIPSAATLNLDAQFGDYHHVGGTTAITAVTLSRGRQRMLVFDSSPVYTNGASLILIGNQNRTPVSGDISVLRGEAAGVVREVSALQSAAHSLAADEWIYSVTGSAVPVLNIFWTAAQASAVDFIEIWCVGMIPANNNQPLDFRFSIDGSTFDSGNNYHWTNNNVTTNPATLTTTSNGAAAVSLIQATGAINNSVAASSAYVAATISNPSSTTLHRMMSGKCNTNTSGSGWSACDFGGFYVNNGTGLRGIQAVMSSGNITGTMYAIGKRKS